MPVSKKRKKDGKPVHRSVPVPEAGGADRPAGQAGEPVPERRVGRPANPFVTAQQGRRASQRGR
jgi:hypothetical protein